MVMLVNGFVHFTMALSVEGVHKGNLYYTAEKQQNFINYNNGAQFMNQRLASFFAFVFSVHSCHASCLFIHPCLCTFPVYPCHVCYLFIHAMYVSCLPIYHV